MTNKIKKISVPILLLLTSIFSGSLTIAAPNNSHGQGTNMSGSILLSPMQDIDDNETSALIWMREEEKLARDVYLTLRDTWNLLIFDDIAASEQNHMDQVKLLLDKYGIEDPVESDAVGSFSLEAFTDLYNSLVAQGNISIIEALKVGATIEDLDIEDLNKRIGQTDNDDIRQVFERLRNGSYNHMRSFVSSLESYGDSYAPQYITEEEFEEIISESNGMGQHYSSSYTMLPGTFKKYTEQEKVNFTLTPTMNVLSENQGQSAEIYALIYAYSNNAWYMVINQNSLSQWNPGEALQPLDDITLGDKITFPIFTESLDLTGLTGTFDVYMGYKMNDGTLVYQMEQLIFE